MFSFDDLPARYWSRGCTAILWQLVVWTLVDFVLEVMLRDDATRFIVMFALAAGQYATLAGWLALGDGPVFVRLVFVLHAMLWTDLLTLEDFPPGGNAVLAAATIMVWSAGLALVRLLGWRCRLPEDSAAPPRLQFRIWHVLVLMTLLGLVLGGLRLVPEMHRREGRAVSLVALCLGIVPWTHWIVQLRPRLNIALPAGLLVVVTTWVVVLAWLARVDAPSEILGVWSVVVGLHTLVLGLNLALLRGYGYRLLRPAWSGEKAGS